MDGPVTGHLPPEARAIEPREARLDALLADRRLWRGARAVAEATGIASGHPALDAALPEGGFPAAALTEVFVPSTDPELPPGKGELALFLPALARLATDRLIALVAPPAVPYAPALAAAGIALERVVVVQTRDARDAAWATEQALRDGSCAAVLAWIEKRGAGPVFRSGDTRPIVPHARAGEAPLSLRRLQLAAEAGGALGVLYRPWTARRSASPAALRIALAPTAGGLCVEVQKCRGSSARTTIAVALDDGPAATLAHAM
jgi:hypothetical protein